MKKIMRLVAGTLLLSSSVFAQSAGPPTPPPSGTPPPPDSIDLSVGQAPTLSVQEMNTQAREYQQNMSSVLKRIHGLEDTARKQKDIIKLNCVINKQVEAKVNASIADQAMASLQENIARADEGGRIHEFTRLTIINQKVTVLGAEAENCIGEDLSFVGATRVDLDIDPNIPRDDPTQPALPTTPIDRPPAASVYR